MHVHKGQMRSGTSRVCVDLCVGRGTWSLRLASLPRRAGSSSLPSVCRLPAVSSGKPQGRWAPPHAPSDISLGFLLPCTSGKARTREQGGIWQVGRSHLFSPWLAARGDLEGLMVSVQPRLRGEKKPKKKTILSFPEIWRTQKNAAKVFPSCEIPQDGFSLLPQCLWSWSVVGVVGPDHRTRN